MKRTRTRIELVCDDLMSALHDTAVKQCEERNPFAVHMLMQEYNRIRALPRKFRNIFICEEEL
ncbi:MAG TPA: hypothetical protein VLG09_03820 [Candidatus Saccharimonadales bacterium]|nr:hypothetical protein [Candidatus Saccharimonadales bacterium]